MKFDLHIHSCNSYDSFSSIKDVIATAKQRGLTGIAITDHDSYTITKLSEMTTNNGFWIISGAEIKTELGDIIGLFISKPLMSRSSMDLIDEIHAQNGIAVLAHPFKRVPRYPEIVLQKLDAIEALNCRWQNLSWIKDEPRVRDLFSTVKGRTAGSDAHFLFEVGRGYWQTNHLTSLEDLKESLCKAEGHAACVSFSHWPQVLSQGINFCKNPSVKDFARIFYYILRTFNVSSQ